MIVGFCGFLAVPDEVYGWWISSHRNAEEEKSDED